MKTNQKFMKVNNSLEFSENVAIDNYFQEFQLRMVADILGLVPERTIQIWK